MHMLPRLSEQFHLTPTDVWALTIEELNVYVDAAHETDKATKAAGHG
jgi:hypothetical protein